MLLQSSWLNLVQNVMQSKYERMSGIAGNYMVTVWLIILKDPFKICENHQILGTLQLENLLDAGSVLYICLSWIVKAAVKLHFPLLCGPLHLNLQAFDSSKAKKDEIIKSCSCCFDLDSHQACSDIDRNQTISTQPRVDMLRTPCASKFHVSRSPLWKKPKMTTKIVGLCITAEWFISNGSWKVTNHITADCLEWIW